MTQLSIQEIEKLRKRITAILDQTVQDKKAVISIYSIDDPSRDARITGFSKLIDVFRATELALIFITKHLMDKKWWHDVCLNQIETNGLNAYINGYVRFIKFGLVHGVFSCIESSIRLYLRYLDPTACRGGLDNFENIYKCLLQSKLSKPRPDGVKLLHLLRLIRNTIHNNGVHFNKNGKEYNITRNGTMYEFKQGFLVRGITWDFILTILDEGRALLKTIVEDDKMKAITGEISDPAGPYGS